MTEENLFENSDCPVEAVPVVDFDFIPRDIVCAASPIPQPIFSCTAPIILPEPPTDVGVDCPVFTAISNIAVGYSAAAGGEESCAVPATPAATLLIRRTNVDPCDYEIDLDLNIPIPRPPCEVLFNAGTFNSNVGFAECVPPQASIQINKTETPGTCDTPDQCEYTIDLEIGIPIPRVPCPEIRVNNFLTQVGYAVGGADPDICPLGENRFDIIPVHSPPQNCDDPGQCAFEIDLQIAVPIPVPPCPVINIAGFDVVAGYDVCVPRVDNRFTLVTRQTPPQNCEDAGTCEFDLELQIGVPIPTPVCPNIDIGSVGLTTGFLGGGGESNDGAACDQSFISVTINRDITPATCDTAPTCNFELNFDGGIFIPKPPCPVLNVTDFIVNAGYAQNAAIVNEAFDAVDSCGTGPNRFIITPTHVEGVDCSDPGQCSFDIALEINVPIPKTPCPLINVTDFSVVAGEQDCLEDRVNKFAITTRHTAGTSCTDPGSCEFDIALELAIPTPPINCPTITTGDIFVRSGFGGGGTDGEDCTTSLKFEISKTETKDCTGGVQCDFLANLDLAVFVPRPPCPTIFIDDFQVATAFEGCPVLIEGNVFEIVTRHIPPTNCNDTGTCDFGLVLKINVPIPRPTCPIITVKEFEVNTKIGGGCLTGPSVFQITPKITEGDICDAPFCEFETVLKLNIPIPEIPCPRINITKFTVESGTGDCVTNSNQFKIIQREIAGTCDSPKTCEFDLELEIAIPIPEVRCPEIRVGKFAVKSGFAGGNCIGENKFEVIKTVTASGDCDSAEQCEFELNLEIAIPIPEIKCPTITTISQITIRPTNATEASGVGSFSVQAPAAGGPNCDVAPECSFNLVFFLDLQIPRVCDPKIVIAPVLVSAGYDQPTYFFATVTNLPRPECVMTIGLDLSINIPRPPCSIGTGQVTLIELAPRSPPFANMAVINNNAPGDYCGFNIILNLGIPRACETIFLAPISKVWLTDDDPPSIVRFEIQQVFVTLCPAFIPILELSLPRPCRPKFYRGRVDAEWLPHNAEPRVEFSIEEVTRCEYRYDLSVFIPKRTSRLVKGEIEAYYTICEADGGRLEFATFEITDPDENGVQQLNVMLIVPKPLEWEADPEDWDVVDNAGNKLGTGKILIKPSPGDNCKRLIGGRITLNTAKCEEGGGGGGSGSGGSIGLFQEKPTVPQLKSSSITTTDTAQFEQEFDAAQNEAAATIDDKILNTVVRNLQLDDNQNPVNPAFYEQMKTFFMRFQDETKNE
jgi:hypothetical protein